MIKELELKAIERLKVFEPPEGYYFANSGGKDSGVVRHLLIKSGIKFDSHYNWTTVDPPELLKHIKENCPETLIDHPDITMWELIIKKRMPPTRLVRYCCEFLKERGGKGRIVITGIRWKESFKRSKRQMIETCLKNGDNKTYLHPIIEWTEDQIWEYTKRENIKYCSLYDQGFKRLGCIGCPMQGKKGMIRAFERWPKYKEAYLRTFQRTIDKRIKDGLKTTWTTGQEMFDWWLK